MSAVLRTLPADWVVKLLRIAWPCATAALSEQVQQGIAEHEREDRAAATRTEATLRTEPFGNGTNGAAAGSDGEAGPCPEARMPGKRRVVAEANQRTDRECRSRTEENMAAGARPADGLEEMLVSAEVLDLVVAFAGRPIANGDNGSKGSGKRGASSAESLRGRTGQASGQTGSLSHGGSGDPPSEAG
jgi:hypothetical protein